MCPLTWACTVLCNKPQEQGEHVPELGVSLANCQEQGVRGNPEFVVGRMWAAWGPYLQLTPMKGGQSRMTGVCTNRVVSELSCRTHSWCGAVGCGERQHKRASRRSVHGPPPCCRGGAGRAESLGREDAGGGGEFMPPQAVAACWLAGGRVQVGSHF